MAAANCPEDPDCSERREVFQAWAIGGSVPDHDGQDFGRVFDSLNKAGSVKVGTLFHYATEAGWRRPDPCGPTDDRADIFDRFLKAQQMRELEQTAVTLSLDTDLEVANEIFEWHSRPTPETEAQTAADRAAGRSGYDILQNLEAMLARACHWLRPRTGSEGLNQPPIALA